MIKSVVTSKSNPFFPRTYGTKDERFWAKVVPEPNSGCWIWCGDTNGNYGSHSMYVDKKPFRVLAHRFSYELLVGKIPEGKQIDHLCKNKFCVNPDHLELVTPYENTMRTPVGARGNNQIKEKCKLGHELNGSNLAFDGRGHAKCRKCSVLYAQAYQDRNPRRHLSRRDKIAILVAHCFCACGCGRKLLDPKCVDYDHVIALTRGGADTNENMQPMLKGCHKNKTFGRKEGAEKTVTTRGSDLGEAARTKKIQAKDAVHRAAMASKAGNYKAAALILATARPPKPKRKWPTRAKTVSPNDPTDITSNAVEWLLAPRKQKFKRKWPSRPFPKNRSPHEQADKKTG